VVLTQCSLQEVIKCRHLQCTSNNHEGKGGNFFDTNRQRNTESKHEGHKEIEMYTYLKECHPRCVYQNYNGLIINNGSQKHNYICKYNNLPN